MGVLCEAQYTDGKWYAAKIIEKMKKGTWKVLYTEYNEAAVLKSAKMRMRAGAGSGGGGGGGGGGQKQKQNQAQGKGKGKKNQAPAPQDEEEDEDDEDYDPEEDSGEEEEEEDRSGLVVSARIRVKAHKIGCLSAFPHVGSKTALPLPDREVAAHLEEGMEVLVKGKTGAWLVVGIVRNKARFVAHTHFPFSQSVPHTSLRSRCVAQDLGDGAGAGGGAGNAALGVAPRHHPGRGAARE